MGMVQIAFIDRVLTEEATWKAVVLISKGVITYRSIGLVEVVWKAVMVVLNFRFIASINYHDFLHGFCAGCRTRTATPEVKLLQQVTTMGEEVFQGIILDLHKSYGALDRPRCLDILEGYGVGTRDLCLLRRYWDRIQMVE